MKIKVDNIEFVSFSDGICDIYSEDENGIRINNKYSRLGFSNRFLGYNRAFAAKVAQVQVNAVIRIPQVIGINNHDYVDIRGKGKYIIELIQPVFDSNPLGHDLTLRQLEMFEVTS